MLRSFCVNRLINEEATDICIVHMYEHSVVKAAVYSPDEGGIAQFCRLLMLTILMFQSTAGRDWRHVVEEYRHAGRE